MTMRRSRLAAGLLIPVYFLLLTRGALDAAFSPDDTMNLYRSWSLPLPLLVRANLLFWESSMFYRPLPSAWYRTIYHFAGFHPRAFHAANLAILTANILLTYAAARRLSGSREVGFFAALLGSYHPNFAHLYFDTGFIYDVLCYFFYFAAFVYYLRVRQAERFPGVPALPVLAALYICALNSKEMAATLPLFLFLYEVLYHPPASRSRKELRRWIFCENRAALVTGVITIVYAVGRMTGADSVGRNVAYQPVFSWARFMESS